METTIDGAHLNAQSVRTRAFLCCLVWLTQNLAGCQPTRGPAAIRAGRDMRAGYIEGTILHMYHMTSHLPKDMAEVRHVMRVPRGDGTETDELLDCLTIRRYVGEVEAPDCPNPTKLRIDGWPRPYDEERYRWIDLVSEFGRPSAKSRTGNYLTTIVTGSDGPAGGFKEVATRKKVVPAYGWRYPRDDEEIKQFKEWLKELFYPSTALLDGWGRELRFAVSGPEDALIFEARSAGEDGRFGTKDDLVQRVRVPKPDEAAKSQ